MAEECRRLFPKAAIKEREYIKGKVSGTMREIDLSIREKIGPQQILIVIDCKDHQRPVDVKTVESFCGLKDDVSAHAGIIISRAGFTKSALRVAENRLVTTYQYANFKTTNKWPEWIWMGFTLDLWLLTPLSVTLHLPDGSEKPIIDEAGISILDSATNDKVSMGGLLQTLWGKDQNHKEGDFCYSVQSGITKEMLDQKIQINFRAKRFHAYRKGKLHFRGLADPVAKRALSDEYTAVMTGLPVKLNSNAPVSIRKDSGLSILVSSTLVHNPDLQAKAMIKLLLNGHVELQVKTKTPFEWSLPKS